MLQHASNGLRNRDLSERAPQDGMFCGNRGYYIFFLLLLLLRVFSHCTKLWGPVCSITFYHLIL
jgi:hypothetical protein